MATGMDFGLASQSANDQAAYWAGLIGNSKDANKISKAAQKAQAAYQQKSLELQSQGLALQADQIAKQYAMDQAKLEWDKESFKEQFGHQVSQDDIDNKFREKQSALDETWRTAEQTGFRNGVPTLDTLKFNETTRQFDVTAAAQASQYQQTFGEGQRQFNETFGEGQRQFDTTFGEGQRQFNVGTVLNAPRGPADWAAYTNRLRGVQSSGSMPGAVGSMFDPNANVASYSNGGQATGHVLSNTELALAATGQGNQSQLQGTPWGQSMPQQGGMSAMSTDFQGAYDPTPGATSARSAPSADQQGTDMSLPSIQKFRKYAPNEQQMGLGYLSENGGPTEDDAKYLMGRQAPNYARSSNARYAGV